MTPILNYISADSSAQVATVICVTAIVLVWTILIHVRTMK